MSIPVFGPSFQRPLTANQITKIEEAMNMLICDLFPPGEKREAALASDLTDKLDGYLAIAESVEADPNLKHHVELGLGEMMRELLKAVNEYYHNLN